MSGTLTLCQENMLSWFTTLGGRLARSYRMTTTYSRNGGGHLGTIYSRGTETSYFLALFQVQSSVHYVVALCETDGSKAICHQAWSLLDDSNSSASPPKWFCATHKWPHATNDPACPVYDTVTLNWNSSHLYDPEKAESLIKQITDYVAHELGNVLVPAP
jgi:hypothetical protein